LKSSIKPIEQSLRQKSKIFATSLYTREAFIACGTQVFLNKPVTNRNDDHANILRNVSAFMKNLGSPSGRAVGKADGEGFFNKEPCTCKVPKLLLYSNRITWEVRRTECRNFYYIPTHKPGSIFVILKKSFPPVCGKRKYFRKFGVRSAELHFRLLNRGIFFAIIKLYKYN